MTTKETQFWETLKNNGLIERVMHLILHEHHSSGMIVDFLIRDYPGILDKIMPLGCSVRSRILTVKGLKVSPEYNKKPQAWKLQYRYSSEEVARQCAKGGAATIAIRKERNVPYNGPQSQRYWELQGLNPNDAQDRATDFKRQNSPRCPEFWEKKGFSPVEAKTKISTQAINGVLACLKKTQKPNTECAVAQFLESSGIYFGTQLRVSNTKATDKRSVFVFDFHIPSSNTLIEVNGTFWHADKRVFQPMDVVRFPGDRVFLAQEIWQRDENKRIAAELAGYRVVTVWELDLKDDAWKQNLLKSLK
jgi:G:T-mismatch repair DNA endonuclease (very short patch repair protein)